jgi:uncharacterized membrane protein (Fun14 family)
MSHVPPDDAGNAPARRRPVREFGAHLVHMPRWHKGVLLVALALAVVGLIGQARTGHPSADSANVSSAPGGSRGFVSSDADQNPSPAAAPTVSNKLSRYAAHVGLLFLLGFILGYAFRAFLKTTVAITFLAVAVLTGLSYFHVLNVDFTTAAENKIKSESSWLSDQAARLKDSLLAHFHGSVSAAAGMFLGFRRK